MLKTKQYKLLGARTVARGLPLEAKLIQYLIELSGMTNLPCHPIHSVLINNDAICWPSCYFVTSGELYGTGKLGNKFSEII